MIRAVILYTIACVACATTFARAAETPPKDDALQSGSVWTGNVSGDERKPNRDADRGATLRVTSREGAKFTAQFVVKGNALFALELEGEVRNAELRAKVTKIIRGRWPDGTVNETWSGTLNGERLTLKHTNKQNLVSTAELTLDPDAPSTQRKRKQD